jgi:KDO2-lipid IV(A) lauroyltransferase
MYYLVYGIAYGISLIPFWILYGIADILFVLTYYVFGYRKKVVMDNLRASFPEKHDKDLRSIARKFYRNFIDNWLEAIKLLSVSHKELDKRFRCDYSLTDRLAAEGRSCTLLLGHVFNWEYANAHFSGHSHAKFLVVYMPLGSKAMDRIFFKLRERFGTTLLPATHMSRAMVPYRNTVYVLTLVADQNPGSPETSYWCDFMGRPAPFVKGPERSARMGNLASVFVSIKKLRRGYYEAKLSLGNDDPRVTPEGEITQQFVQFLEKEIREQPENWLWSHRRWKHDYKPEYEALRIDRKA